CEFTACGGVLPAHQRHEPVLKELSPPELSRHEDWSAGDVAAAFAEVLGHPVAPAFIPPEQRAADLAEAGVPAQTVAALVGMYDSIAAGRVTREVGTEQRRGTVSLTAAVERIVTNA